MTDENQEHTYSERYIYLFMDAAGRGLPVDASCVEAIEMQMRHNAFEVEMTEAATAMLETPLAVSDPRVIDVVEQAIERLRAGESMTCKTTFPEAAFSMLWAWHIVSTLDWQWQAVRRDWWETMAIADAERRYVILPVQYMRGLTDRNPPTTRTPRQVFEEIRSGQLPAAEPNQLLRLY